VGVKLPLSSEIKDAYYVIPANISKDPDGLPDTALLGIKSLDTSCGAVTPAEKDFNNALGAIAREIPTDHDPVTGETFTQLYPNGVTIGSYYYGYTNALGRNKTCAPQNTLQAIDAAFTNSSKATTTAAN
jgi:hypothetical protein